MTYQDRSVKGAREQMEVSSLDKNDGNCLALAFVAGYWSRGFEVALGIRNWGRMGTDVRRERLRVSHRESSKTQSSSTSTRRVQVRDRKGAHVPGVPGEPAGKLSEHLMLAYTCACALSAATPHRRCLGQRNSPYDAWQGLPAGRFPSSYTDPTASNPPTPHHTTASRRPRGLSPGHTFTKDK